MEIMAVGLCLEMQGSPEVRHFHQWVNVRKREVTLQTRGYIALPCEVRISSLRRELTMASCRCVDGRHQWSSGYDVSLTR